MCIRDRGTRGHSFKLVKLRCTCDSRKHFFSNKVITRWNLLNQGAVDATSVNAFKERLEKLRDTMSVFFFDGPWPGPGSSRSFSRPRPAQARAQPFFFVAPAGPGGPKLARPLPAAVIGHAHLSRFSYLQMASASDVQR